MAELAKQIIVIGGPNGAGKTTVAKVLLPQKMGIGEFVNADEIARGLSPDNAESAAISAGRAMLERMNGLLAGERPFAFETTCSGHGHIAFLRRAKIQGWSVSLLFLWLSSPEEAVRRVALRVRRGGHDIPEAIVRRRYRNGLRNFRQGYLPVSDIAAIYDNSGEERRLVAEKNATGELVVHDSRVWAAIRTEAK